MPKSSCDSIRALRDLTRRCSRKSNEQFAPWGWNNFQINRPFLNKNQIIQFIAHKIFAPDVLMYFLFASYFTSPVFCAPIISPIRARSMCVYVGGMCAMRFILCDEPFVRSITIIERCQRAYRDARMKRCSILPFGDRCSPIYSDLQPQQRLFLRCQVQSRRRHHCRLPSIGHAKFAL